MKCYWGDIHNHCSISYGKGTLKRALANAREQLDFCSITGHAFWPDMPMDLERFDDIVSMHLAGFTKLKYFWNSYLEAVKAANQEGRFVTFPSYEWHSMRYGDHNCYVKSDELPLLDADSPEQLFQKLTDANVQPILLPHHIGYKRGFRGLNWEYFNPQISPLVEIYSNHGASESDEAPYAYHHSMGPRSGDSMARYGLSQGFRFGFYASTDSHDGYPGHYGHGRFGVWAEDLTRDKIWEAIRARRTIASTGARILASMELADTSVGGSTLRKPNYPYRLKIEGESLIDKVEWVEGGGGEWKVHRLHPSDPDSMFSPGRYKVRVETGWGRKGKRSFWNVEAQVTQGALLGATPYFRYSGYQNDEQESTEKILSQDDSSVCWKASAIPNAAGSMGGTHFDAGGTQSVVLEVDARENTRLKIRFDDGELDYSIAELRRQSFANPVAGFGSPAMKVHRAMGEKEYIFQTEGVFQPSLKQTDYLYLRITQSDGQVAWCSPVWFD